METVGERMPLVAFSVKGKVSEASIADLIDLEKQGQAAGPEPAAKGAEHDVHGVE